MGAFFAKLKAMLGGPAPFETLESFSRAGLPGLLEELDEDEKRTFELILCQPYPESIQQWKKYPNLLSEWENDYFSGLRDSLRADTRNEQKINIRRLVLKLNESRILNTIYRLQHNEDDRKLICANVFNGSSFEETESMSKLMIMRSELSLILLRQIQKLYFDDFRDNDYYSFHTDCYSQFVNVLYGNALAVQKGETYTLAPLLKVLDEAVEEVKKKALEGQDCIYPKADDSHVESEYAEQQTNRH